MAEQGTGQSRVSRVGRQGGKSRVEQIKAG